LAKCSKMGVRFIRVNRCWEIQEGAQESTWFFRSNIFRNFSFGF
jgi:hypothetical protein